MKHRAAADTDVACAHCGLRVPAAWIEPTASEQFCCAGCRTAYEVIGSLGLTQYYRLRSDASASDSDARDRSAAPARASGRSYAEFDDDTFERLYTTVLPSGRRQAAFYAEGVHCAACVWLLERAAVVVPGVAEVRVDLGRSRVRVTWDPAQTRPSAIARFFDSVGYPVHPYRETERERRARQEDRALLVRIAVTGAVAGNVMLIAFALYGGAFDGMDPEYAALFRWASLLLTIPALLFGGTTFFRGAWAGLRVRTLHMDLPISLGILAGFAGGACNTVRGVGDVYFDSVTALIFLLLVGRFLQRAQQRRAAESTDLLHMLAPRRARRLGPGGVTEVLAEALAVGDRIEVLPGDLVPADGEIVEGRSSLDLSLLTGESEPIAVGLGSVVHAGTTNVTSRFVLVAQQVGEATRVGQLVRRIDDCSQSRPRIVRLADRWAAAFVGTVVLLAGVTTAAWSWIDPGQALDHTLALLVVSCPCALGLATPLAITAAVGRAARAGLLIKTGDVFESLLRPGTLYLDKTGTLTDGRMSVSVWHGDRDARSLLLGLEAQSTHPIARAIARAFPDVPLAPVIDVRHRAGGGLTGTWNGTSVCAGSPSFVRARGVTLAGAWSARLAEVRTRRLTPVVLARGGEVMAVAGLGDALREEAPAVVERLRGAGWRVAILSGDDAAVVDRVGERLGVEPADRLGSRSPEDKLSCIEAARAIGPVVMVGDGVNDAAALAAATVGIGMHGGAEAVLAASDVFIARGGVAGVARLIDGANDTVRVIRRNIAFSIIYNSVGAALAVAGLVHPLLAAVLMPLSSLTVIVSSYRTRAFAAPGDRAVATPTPIQLASAGPEFR
ncbi:MAG: heavy metal translocating P-type ATPase metal-binding domain-containing protein [Planctomycetota bacterium]